VSTTGAVDLATSAEDVSLADEGKRVVAKQGVVASANGLASDAGLAMLRAGGNAIDGLTRAGGQARLPRLLRCATGAPGSARREPGDLRIVGIPGNVAGLLVSRRCGRSRGPSRCMRRMAIRPVRARR
jgi:hypothetical protein